MPSYDSRRSLPGEKGELDIQSGSSCTGTSILSSSIAACVCLQTAGARVVDAMDGSDRRRELVGGSACRFTTSSFRALLSFFAPTGPVTRGAERAPRCPSEEATLVAHAEADAMADDVLGEILGDDGDSTAASAPAFGCTYWLLHMFYCVAPPN